MPPGAAEQPKIGQTLPSGAVLTMEAYGAKLHEKCEPVTDANGRFLKGDLTGIFVMEKRIGWGAEYPDDLRNGEWEYARLTAGHHPPPGLRRLPSPQ